MHRSTGQASLEFVLLTGLAALVALGLGVALASGAAGSTADALRRALRPPSPVRDDTWAIGSATWGPLIRRYAPRVVLERDVYGEDASVPVDFARCRAAGVRAIRRRPRGRVRPSRAPGRSCLYPLLALLPRLARDPPARRRPRHAPRRLGGRDRPARRRRRRGAGHGARRAGRSRPVVGGRARAGGRSARGRSSTAPPAPTPTASQPGDIDLAGDRWNGTLGEVDPTFVAADLARSRRFRFDAGRVAAVDEAPLARSRRGRHGRRRHAGPRGRSGPHVGGGAGKGSVACRVDF